MGKTDFSQLSKGMFKKSAQVGEIKPLPKTKAVGGDDVLSFFGLNAPETPTCASVAGSGDGRILALEADVRTVRAESAALEAAKAEAERKAGDLECQLAAERHMREAAGAAIDFTCGIWDNSPREVSFEFFDGRLRGVSDGDAGAGVGGFFFSSSARRERC